MKTLFALLLLTAAATPAGAHARSRVTLGGTLAYTARGEASAEMIGFGVSLIASTVSAIAYDGCPRTSEYPR